jgi:hypothetical protein
MPLAPLRRFAVQVVLSALTPLARERYAGALVLIRQMSRASRSAMPT